jgi:hypothetical protein
MVAVADGSIGACAGCAHGCAVALLEVVGTKRMMMSRPSRILIEGKSEGKSGRCSSSHQPIVAMPWMLSMLVYIETASAVYQVASDWRVGRSRSLRRSCQLSFK